MSESEIAPKKPKKRRWYHNFADAYRLVARHEKWAGAAIIGSLVAGPVVGWLIGMAFNQPIYGAFIGVFAGLLGAMLLLAWRTRIVSYAQIDGQPGASFAVLDQIKRGWSMEQQPAQVNARTQDLVFRIVGRPGVVLISEGPSDRVARLLSDEKKRVQRVIPASVPIIYVESGHGPGQVPLTKLESRIKSFKKVLTAQEVDAVAKRLRSLGTMNLPIPKGIDPTKARPDRKGMRGR